MTGKVYRHGRLAGETAAGVDALGEARRVLAAGGILLANVRDRIEENPHALTNAAVVEAMRPGDPGMKFRMAYDMNDPGLLRRLLTGARLRELRIETKRIPIAAANPRSIATAQIRGTPRSALIRGFGVFDAHDARVTPEMVPVSQRREGDSGGRRIRA